MDEAPKFYFPSELIKSRGTPRKTIRTGHRIACVDGEWHVQEVQFSDRGNLKFKTILKFRTEPEAERWFRDNVQRPET